MSEIDTSHLPQHIAFIMDGNRRWAKKQGLTPTQGHQAGADTLEKIVNYAHTLGIKHLTFYALSTENWRNRSSEEVKGIFKILLDLINNKAPKYRDKGIKLNILGNYLKLPTRVKNSIQNLLQKPIHKYNLTVNIALNYGGRDELITAVKKIVKEKLATQKITEKLISKYLYTHGQPDPELIIRPGGEIRLSNFLLWQSSYSELYFSDIFWPDFNEEEFSKAIAWYQHRKRNHGA